MGTLVQQAIADRRHRENLSALALAREIDISSNQLAALERGEDVPSLHTLKKLARFFDWDAKTVGQYVIDCKTSPTGPKRLRQERR